MRARAGVSLRGQLHLERLEMLRQHAAVGELRRQREVDLVGVEIGVEVRVRVGVRVRVRVEVRVRVGELRRKREVDLAGVG